MGTKGRAVGSLWPQGANGETSLRPERALASPARWPRRDVGTNPSGVMATTGTNDCAARGVWRQSEVGMESCAARIPCGSRSRSSCYPADPSSRRRAAPLAIAKAVGWSSREQANIGMARRQLEQLTLNQRGRGVTCRLTETLHANKVDRKSAELGGQTVVEK